MLPAPPVIIQTPAGTKVCRHGDLMSGNTFGARLWTDGKFDTPMLPERSALQCVEGSLEIFWVSDAEEIQEMPWGASVEGVANAAPPGVADYHRALKYGMADTPEREIYIRVRLWWLSNDPVRTGKGAPETFGRVENLTRIAELLDITEDENRIMLAEIHRELGDFQKAKDLLDHPFRTEIHNATSRIRDLARRESTLVAEIK